MECGQVLLKLYEAKYKEEVCSYVLPLGQSEFTALPYDALERFGNHPHAVGVVILHNDEAVGFFVLHKANDAMEDGLQHQLLIRSLSINPEYQGRGFGTRAMELLPAFVRRIYPETKELFLMVNEGNKHAQKVYEKAGYIDRGMRRMGPKGWQKVLHYAL
ncbi:MAG: GNAT family N-acetyltransferase [Bacillus sp. (in: firmicutes)]